MSTPLWEPTSDTPHVCASSQSLSALSPAWDPRSDLSYLADNPALPVATSSAPSTSTASNEFSIATRRAEFTKRMAALHTLNVNTLPPPETRKEALWHPQSGLFVSPNATYIPRIEPNDVRRPNPSIPRILPDDEFFLAFRPRIIRNSGILFGRLNMSNASLAKAVVSATGGYMLDPFVLESWLRLENAFLDLCDSLLPKSDVPLISYPVFPYERGYRHTHRSRDAAVRCAIRSRDAFIELSSLVSFIIALNMDKDGSYEGAFYKLRTRQYHPVHSAWLDLLKISQVCDFSDNARVGVVVNPYTSRWGFPLFKFFLARVPIWFFWGHNHRDTLPAHTMYNFFLPPDNIVEKAIDLARKSTNLILPSYRFDPYESSALTQQLGQALDASPYVADTYTPQSPMPFSSPPVSTPPSDWSTYEPSIEPLPLNASDAASSRDKALAALEEFFAGRCKRREDKMKVETMKERQSRESMEAYAKSRDNFSSTSTVYEWIEDGNGNYERTKVDSNPAVERWGEFTKNQRRYTFPNQWDLCPQLPKYSAEFPEEDDKSDWSDPDESDDPNWKPMGRIVDSSAPRSLAIPENGTSDTLLDLQVIHCTEASETHEPTPAEISELAPFLRDRIGYAMPTGWSIRVPEKRDDMPPPQSTSSSSRRKVTPSSTSSRGEMGKMKGPANSLPNHSLSSSREEVGYKRRREETERLPSRPTSSYLPDVKRRRDTSPSYSASSIHEETRHDRGREPLPRRTSSSYRPDSTRDDLPHRHSSSSSSYRPDERRRDDSPRHQSSYHPDSRRRDYSPHRHFSSSYRSDARRDDSPRHQSSYHPDSRRYDNSPHRHFSSSSYRPDARRDDSPRRYSSSYRPNMGRDQMREDLPPRQRKGNAPVTATSKEDVAITTLTKALLSMSFGKVDVNADADTGIVDLTNLLASSKGTFANLPSNFDHSAASSAPLSLASDTLEVLVASSGETPVYLLRNSGGRLCDDPWMIATGDASTVLLVFRKKWATVDIIARELVRRGTRFNTVRAVANRPETASPPVRTLGLRPSGYKPTREDYQEYVRRRNNLLQGSKGCAALKWGGIIARIARDVLPDQGIVLDGPVTGDCVICEYDKLFFVDDQLTETEKNFICGVYVSQTEDAPEGELLNGTRVDISWWPKDSMWQTLNCYLTLEWTELAEVFYQKRKRDMEAELSMINASGWRLYLRKANTWTKKVEAGAEYYQRGYLDHCLAAARASRS